jgi:hypothetical protein
MNIRKNCLVFGAIILAAYGLWLIYLSFRFHPYGQDTTNPLEPEGVYHLHSRFSDGRASAETITRTAAKAGLDFIILTDHGRPNFPSLSFQGKKEGIFVFSGSELSVNRGHLVGLFFEIPTDPFSAQAEEAARQIQARRGLTIIAHPYSKTHWSWGEKFIYEGLEICNADTMVKKNFLPLFPYLPLLVFKSQIPLLKMLSYPRRNLHKWDSLNQKHKVYGYYATDAHLLYKSLFRLFHLHLLLNHPLSSDFHQAWSQVRAALKEGRFYNAVEAAAEADGFRFWIEKQSRVYPMGSVARIEPPLQLRIEAPFAFLFQIVIRHNGHPLWEGSSPSLSLPIKQPGVYRVEVYLRENSPLHPNIPWIMSNPIWVEKEN